MRVREEKKNRCGNKIAQFVTRLAKKFTDVNDDWSDPSDNRIAGTSLPAMAFTTVRQSDSTEVTKIPIRPSHGDHNVHF